MRPRATPFAKRSLGQNFLVDDTFVNRIVDSLDPTTGESIIEIGPGRGAITDELAASEATVVAIELDSELARLLRERFARHANVCIVEANAAEAELAEILTACGAQAPAKVVANLPYNVSTVILQRLAEQRHLFSELILMFQKEVVDRITAEPGDSGRGFLTVIAEAAFKCTALFDVPPSAFRPRPKVTSTVVRLIPKSASPADEREFRALLSAAFAQKRKTIANNLKALSPDAVEAIERAGIDPMRRAETLTLEDWYRLHSNFAA